MPILSATTNRRSRKILEIAAIIKHSRDRLEFPHRIEDSGGHVVDHGKEFLRNIL